MFQSVGKFSGVHYPISQSRFVTGSLAKPTVIHHKNFYPDICCYIRQKSMLVFSNIKGSSFPGVIQDFSHLPGFFFWQHVLSFIIMQSSGHGTESTVRKTKQN